MEITKSIENYVLSQQIKIEKLFNRELTSIKKLMTKKMLSTNEISSYLSGILFDILKEGYKISQKETTNRSKE